MKSTLTLALSAAIALGSVAPVFAQTGTTATGTDCPVMGTSTTGVDPAGDAKAPGAADPCKPAAGSAGASGSDTTGSTTTPGNDATGTSGGKDGGSGANN